MVWPYLSVGLAIIIITSYIDGGTAPRHTMSTETQAPIIGILPEKAEKGVTIAETDLLNVSSPAQLNSSDQLLCLNIKNENVYGCVRAFTQDIPVTNSTQYLYASSGFTKNYTSWDKTIAGYIFLKMRTSMFHVTNVPGIILNPLCVLTAVCIKPFHTSEMCMMFLGISDFCVVTLRYIKILFELQGSSKDWHCKFFGYVLSAFLMSSNLVVAMWTLERLIAVIFPLRLSSLCSVRNTNIGIAVVYVSSFLLTSPYVVDTTLITVPGSKGGVHYTCQYSVFAFKIWMHVESVFYVLLPALFVSVGNFLILRKLKTVSETRKKMAQHQETMKLWYFERRKTTVVLLTISFTFVILHIPYMIHLVWSYIYPDASVIFENDQHDYAVYSLAVGIGIWLLEMQNSINFFLYFLSGSKFRKTLISIICYSRLRKQDVPTQITKMTNVDQSTVI